MSEDSHVEHLTYGRQLLLLGAKREVVLELAEVHRYGLDSFGDVDHVSIYGMAPQTGTPAASGCWGGPRWSAPRTPSRRRSPPTSPPWRLRHLRRWAPW